MFVLFTLPAAVAAVHDVVVTDTGFDPPLIEITAGDTVRWLFAGSVAQSSTSSAGQAESWDSGLVQPNLFFEIQLTTPGDYIYYDQTFGADDGLGGAVGVAGEIDVLSDTDGDGLSNKDEILLGTDGNLADTDSDGLDDGEEVLVRFSDPLDDDTDGDGLLDGEDVDAGASPLDDDTDNDGLTDFEEVVVYGTAPFLADTNLGGLDDGDEVARGSDPLNPADDGLLGPPTLVLVGAPTSTGVNTFDVSGFPANAKVLLVLSTDLGSRVITYRTCTVTSGLGTKPRVQATALADATGAATLHVNVTLPAFSGSVHLQAIATDACIVSNVETVTIP